MQVTFITTGVAGALTHKQYATKKTMFKAAREWLASVNRSKLPGMEKYNCEIWLGDYSTRPYYDPSELPKPKGVGLRGLRALQAGSYLHPRNFPRLPR